MTRRRSLVEKTYHWASMLQAMLKASELGWPWCSAKPFNKVSNSLIEIFFFLLLLQIMSLLAFLERTFGSLHNWPLSLFLFHTYNLHNSWHCGIFLWKQDSSQHCSRLFLWMYQPLARPFRLFSEKYATWERRTDRELMCKYYDMRIGKIVHLNASNWDQHEHEFPITIEFGELFLLSIRQRIEDMPNEA
jgi:hypothetical protein